MQSGAPIKNYLLPSPPPSSLKGPCQGNLAPFLVKTLRKLFKNRPYHGFGSRLFVLVVERFTYNVNFTYKLVFRQFLNHATISGVSNGHKNFQLLAEFGLCSICSQNLDECSLARARKIFAIARMLGFSLKFARFLKIL